MSTFISAEYIIANLFIALNKTNKRENITLDELNKAVTYIREMSISKDIDVILLASSEQVTSAIYSFSDYFEYDNDTKTIRLAKTKSIKDLESRFIGYLPFNVLSFLVNTLHEFAKLKS